MEFPWPLPAPSLREQWLPRQEFAGFLPEKLRTKNLQMLSVGGFASELTCHTSLQRCCDLAAPTRPQDHVCDHGTISFYILISTYFNIIRFLCHTKYLKTRFCEGIGLLASIDCVERFGDHLSSLHGAVWGCRQFSSDALSCLGAFLKYWD